MSLNCDPRIMRASSSRPLKGEVSIPGDKSISHRSLILGALAIGQTRITGLLEGQDVLDTARAMASFGAQVEKVEGGEWYVEGVGVGGFAEPETVVDCGNSGTGVRLIMGAMATTPINVTFTGDHSLNSRPMGRVTDPLSKFGVATFGRSKGRLPMTIVGARSPIPIQYTVPVPSAQVKSALLLAGLNVPGDTIITETEKTRDHTERMLKAFGADISIRGELGRNVVIKSGGNLIGQRILIPGDISSASFWMIAASIVPNSEVLIQNVGLNPTRTGILNVMDSMGCNYEILDKSTIAGEPIGSIKVKTSNNLRSFTIEGDILPKLIDEIPILTVAACFCNGVSEIKDAQELRVKETDRLKVMARQLQKFGAEITEKEDGLIINGQSKFHSAEVDSETDHRVAMSLAIASLLAKGTSKIMRSDAASVSYPTFWEELAKLTN